MFSLVLVFVHFCVHASVRVFACLKCYHAMLFLMLSIMVARKRILPVYCQSTLHHNCVCLMQDD